ncbi:MAG: sigma 54-interacting transcriptional regulator [Deltaproteobacteria bacterium]|nr:sigma 54-interacting transcriptional regulator [Deltaproteobacteria bacterium]
MYSSDPQILRSLFDSLPLPVFVLDRSHQIVLWNKACEIYTGFVASEMEGTRRQWEPFYAAPRPVLADLLLEDHSDAEVIGHYDRGVVRPYSPLPGAWIATDFFPSLGGQERHVQFLAVPVRHQDGEMCCVVETLQDVSQETEISQALVGSLERYRQLFEQVADGVAVLQGGQLVEANPALATLFGFSSPAEMRALASLDLVAPASHRLAREFLEQPWENRPPRTAYELCCLKKSGREFWVRGHAAAISWEGRAALLFTLRDITAQKNQEDSLRREADDLRDENRQLRTSLGDRYRLEGIVGRSRAMHQVFRLILRAAASEAPAVVLGESGTGKELAARAIHRLSRRREKEFVPVNCGAIPETLLESEFFGHKKGAFTGAHIDKHGYLDLAHQGTLFLDEVGEIPLSMQVKLLRVLDTGEFTPLGSNRSQRADLRIIAATNRNLEEMVRDGRMRADFYYRLSVIPIKLPPLRERQEDIPLLVEHFLRQAYATGGAPVLSPAEQASLAAHDWPGNVRELQNVLHRFQSLGRLDFPGFGGKSETTRRSESADSGPDRELAPALNRLEKALMLASLERNHWNRQATARELAISRKTLYLKMKHHGLT